MRSHALLDGVRTEAGGSPAVRWIEFDATDTGRPTADVAEALSATASPPAAS
ncbi:hypothetical protein [Streptomyces canarius]